MGLGPTEIILVILVVVLLFGAKKLPELARGSGRALRIFKAETKGLIDDKDDKDDDKDDVKERKAELPDARTDPHGRPLPSGTEVRPPTYEQVDPSVEQSSRDKQI
ncbi:MAG: Sec-independent protein translocase subunit TatA [Actinomycetota bacterium]|nr:Sec-independent protein translocase subunit TatA [Actinomycetota bacterium]